VFGYEAKGLATSDVVTYTIDRSGKVKNEFWLHQPYAKPGFIHDCAIVGFAVNVDCMDTANGDRPPTG